MSQHQMKTYGERWAPFYDDIYGGAEQSTIDLLVGLAGAHPKALELAIGTGRIALPLAERGVDVTGIDISQDMVDKMRSKTGGQDIEVHIGDIADVAVADTFPLIYLAFNTLFVLTTQDRQVECFSNVAEHLEPGGRFVIDAFVPDMNRWDANNTHMGVSSLSSNEEHAYEMSIHYPVDQRTESHMVRRVASGETVVLPVSIRYAWPSEIDLMARLAGLELESRWDWYDRRAFDEHSGQHVSVYRAALQP